MKRIDSVLCFICILAFFISCHKDSPIIGKPILTTTAASSITQTTATSGGNISSDGGASVIARGVCWSTSANPTTTLTTKTSDGTETGAFTSSITGLTANTTYYVRAYATNSAGTAYGTEVSLSTSFGGQTGTVTDIEGNIYKTVTIGTQTWMAENLRATKYRDGTSIPNVIDATAWSALTTGAYCDYNTTNRPIYGKLYNYYAVVDSRNLCPNGWHVPSDAEWTTLTTFLGGENIAGGKLKEIGITHWETPNYGATNETGFTALPGGYRNSFGYNHFGIYGYWWSSTEYSTSEAWPRHMYYNNTSVFRYTNFDKRIGLSVRCVRDL